MTVTAFARSESLYYDQQKAYLVELVNDLESEHCDIAARLDSLDPVCVGTFQT